MEQWPTQEDRCRFSSRAPLQRFTGPFETLEEPAGGSHESYRCPRRHRHRPPRANSASAAVGNRGREYVADVERFFERTRGHVVIMGRRTFTSVPEFAFKDRDVLEIHASDRPEDVLARFPGRVVFIGGGPPVYAAYAPFIRHWDFNRLPYNGEADHWFDPAWLIAGGH